MTSGLETLVKGLGRLAALEPYGEGCDSGSVALQQVLEDLRIVIEPGWSEIGGSVWWTVSDPCLRVHADRYGLMQVFMNLAQNSHRAVQSCPVRRLSIGVSVRDGRVLDFIHDARESGFAGHVLIVTAGVSGRESVQLIQAAVQGIRIHHRAARERTGAGAPAAFPSAVERRHRGRRGSLGRSRPGVTSRSRGLERRPPAAPRRVECFNEKGSSAGARCPPKDPDPSCISQMCFEKTT